MNTPPSATDEADYLEQKFIPFLLHQLRDAKKKLKKLKIDEAVIQPEIDPPENGATVSRTA